LLHAEALRRLHDEAKQAEQERDWARALSCLGHCLELLPPETRQYRQIQDQARRLAHLYRAEPAQPDPARLEAPGPPAESTPPADRTAAPGQAGALGAAWGFAADSAQLMVRGLTRPRTAISMAVWVVTLGWLIGWRKALGFAAMVYVHEMGHLILIRFFGFRFAWPFFVPFLGAFVLQGKASARPREDAAISLAGPFAGIALSAVLFWLDLAVGLPAVARDLVQLNTVINLTNLLPFWILDGGRLAECSRRGQVLALGLGLLALAFWPFSPFALLLGAGFVLRAAFWKEFEAVRPAAWRPRQNRGEDMTRVLLLTAALILAGSWLLQAMRP
jgi:Zn-dependent protease